MKRKRLTSIMGMVIAVMMCISLLPTMALAADSDFTIENGVLIKYNGTDTNVIIPNNVTAIGDDAFNNTKIENVSIPNSVTSIGASAFAFTYNLSTITIPDSVTSIGALAFYYSGIESIDLSNSITSIEIGTFGYCINLTSITIPNSVVVICDNAFRNCASLSSVEIPNSVKGIGIAAFDYCDSLKSVTIPDSVITIGSGAFSGIDNNGKSTELLVNGKYASSDLYAEDKGIPVITRGDEIKQATEKALLEEKTQTTPTTPPTTDKPSAWAETQVNAAIAANIVPTALQGQYTQATTRAEFCALAVALYENVKGTEIAERVTFNDTTDINVQKAAAIGVVSGVGNNNFAPNDTLTREQAATMLSRLAAAIGKPLTEQAATFADNNSISQWAFSAVGQVQANGVMGGVGNNTFAPQEQYTREQSIVTMTRLYDIVK